MLRNLEKQMINAIGARRKRIVITIGIAPIFEILGETTPITFAS